MNREEERQGKVEDFCSELDTFIKTFNVAMGKLSDRGLQLQKTFDLASTNDRDTYTVNDLIGKLDIETDDIFRAMRASCDSLTLKYVP